MDRQSISEAKTTNNELANKVSLNRQNENNSDNKNTDSADSENIATSNSNGIGLFNHDFCTVPIGIQTKLKIGEVNDKYEQEADRVAEQVIRMPEPGTYSFTNLPRVNNSIQRKCPSCEENELVLRKNSQDYNSEISPDLSSQISSLSGRGRPMSASERGYFEPRFGNDFSNVRVHENSRANDMAKSINARAFALGNNVVFRTGEYSAESSSGKRLFAHELTHVVQQNLTNRNMVQRESLGDSGSSENEVTADNEQRQRDIEALCVGREAGDGPTRCQFTDRQLRRVDLARSSSRRLAARAGLALHSTDRYIRRMARRFFEVEDLNINALLSTIDSIRDSLDSAPVLCGTCSDATCNNSPAAYVPDDFSSIVICPFFFSLSVGQMTRTFLHEAGHYVKIDDRPDYVHPQNCTESDSVDCDEPCSGISDRLNNVDVWARFIECAAYSY